MRITIVTVSYNSSKTISRTIKSIFNQSHPVDEYIIVDGASKDGTLDVVKKYEPLFKGRMRWISEPDSGIYNAMNKGVKLAKGEIIGIVNSDDWLEPDALSLVAKAYDDNNRNNNTLYCGGINYHKVDGSVKKWDVNLKSFKRQAPLFIMSGIRHPATFVPKNVYNSIGLFNEKMKLSADQDFVLRCYRGGVCFYEIHHILSNMSEGGLSTEGTERSNKISEEDRKIMLKQFGKTGVSYYWLWYSWKFRGWMKRLLR